MHIRISGAILAGLQRGGQKRADRESVKANARKGLGVAELVQRERKVVNRLSIVAGLTLWALFFTGCAGVGSPGLLGASSFNARVDYQTAWKALMDVLSDDPTLFVVQSKRAPTAGEDGVVKGSKGGRGVAIWVQPQGKDNTTFAVQVLLGVFPDRTAQENLAQAIADQVKKRL